MMFQLFSTVLFNFIFLVAKKYGILLHSDENSAEKITHRLELSCHTRFWEFYGGHKNFQTKLFSDSSIHQISANST